MSGERFRKNTVQLQERARELRKAMTQAEQVLWKALRGRRMAGLRFRRQHPVGRFILDFYCPAAKLGLEVDGGIHDGQAERDEERSASSPPEGTASCASATMKSSPPSPRSSRGSKRQRIGRAPSPDDGEGGALSRYRESNGVEVTRSLRLMRGSKECCP